ncbi:MAG TPA: four helix bundle protein [Gemmatimonadales bacterium]
MKHLPCLLPEFVMSEPTPAAAPVRSYRDLRVWQQAMDLVEATYRATQQFPTTERYGLITQLRRAAVSVASNIAEGHARSLGDYLRHLLISGGSLTEMETQFIVSTRLGFLPVAESEALLQSCDQVGRMLGGLRKSLRARLSRAPSP